MFNLKKTTAFSFAILLLPLLTGCPSSSSSSSSSSNSLIGTWKTCVEANLEIDVDDVDTEMTYEFSSNSSYFLSLDDYVTVDGSCGGDYQVRAFMTYNYSSNESGTTLSNTDFTNFQIQLSDAGIANATYSNLCGLSNWQAEIAQNSVSISADFSSTQTRYLFAIPDLPSDSDTEDELKNAGDFAPDLAPIITSWTAGESYCNAYQDIDINLGISFTISGDTLTLMNVDGEGTNLVLSK